MLTQVCQYLRNWFTGNEPKLVGTFTVESDSSVTYNGAEITEFKPGQYIRIIGSTFNDGVHVYGDGGLTSETFTGAIWGMAIPQAVIDIAGDITDWCEKYAEAQNSPYQSESFAGYSYTKASGNSGTGASSATWQDVFGSRLAPWRKI